MKSGTEIELCCLIYFKCQTAATGSPGAHYPLKTTVKILKFGTPQTIAIIVLKIEKFDVTLH